MTGKTRGDVVLQEQVTNGCDCQWMNSQKFMINAFRVHPVTIALSIRCNINLSTALNREQVVRFSVRVNLLLMWSKR